MNTDPIIDRPARRRNVDDETFVDVHRHTLGSGNKPVGQLAARVLEVARRISLRMQQTRPAQSTPTPVALAGPMALAIVGNERNGSPSELQLIFAHGERQQVAAIIGNISQRWAAEDRQIARQLLEDARFLQLPHGQAPHFTDVHPPAHTPTGRIERAVRVLQHAAFTTTQSSMVRVRTTTETRWPVLNVLGPDGIVLAHTAELIKLVADHNALARMTTFPTSLRLTETQLTTAHEIRERILQRLDILDSRTVRFVQQYRAISPAPVFRDDYPKLTVPVFDDPDVRSALAPVVMMTSMGASTLLTDALRTINSGALIELRRRERDSAAKPAARDFTR